jgi:triacylglycerol esterase/lipase EstA (alpha/beta hydrolase family)
MEPFLTETNPMREQNKYLSRVFSFALIFAILCGNYAAFAQVKTGSKTVASNQSKQTAPKCSGAWTGNVTYTRTQTMADSKTVKRVSNRGEDKRDWEMRYNYKASVAVLEAPEKNGSNVGKARIEHKFSSIDKTIAREENSCDRGKTWQVMTGNFQTKTETSANATGAEANVSVGVNQDGTYSVSVGLPQIQGQTTGSQTSSFAGQCVPKEGKNLNMPPAATNVEGNSLTSDGTHRVDPSAPNRLSGSYSKTWQNVTETISWNLEKCGAALRITNLKFEDMKYPNWNDWQEIVEQKGTIDGNLVKIKATILNESGETKYADVRFKETYKGDKWDGARPDAPLKDDVASVRVEANSEETVELVWDSSGYAWFDDGRPRLLQRVKAELEENSKKIDEMTENLKVAPKPLVLVHGLWSSWEAWSSWQNILTTSHSYDWKAFPVGEKSENGKMNTGGAFLSTEKTNSIGENAWELEKYVEYAQKDRNAWHVDLVAHSMGGLISRYYISQLMKNNSEDGRPRVSHLVMLGTPNLGSPCADVMNVAFEMLGKNVEAVRQLRQDQVENFNTINKYRKGVKFSALAGNPLPVMCKTPVWNDGVVSVPSAKWTIADTAESKSLHTDLTGTKDFSDFVKPRIAIGPKGNHNPEMPEMPNRTGQTRRDSFGAYFMNAAYKPQPAETENPLDRNSFKPDFAKAVKIGAKQSVEIEIPVAPALNFGLTLMALADVSATLFDDKGAIAGKNLAKTPEAGGWFRSIYVDQPVTAATWKLKLENTSDRELEAVLATWKDAVK